jgi:endonuclease/exonuclease/phosphatase family metal-dependent hydrolase
MSLQFRFAATVTACALIACGHDTPAAPSSASAAPAASATPASITFRVVSWNVQHGYTPDKRHVNQEQIAFLASLKPDVVALQEMAEWDNDMSTMYRQGLESLTGRRWAWRYESDLPKAPVNRRDGNALGSALGVTSQEVQRLDDPSAPDDNNRNRSVIRFAIAEGGVRVDLATTHLDYLDTANRRSQVDRMQAFLARGSQSRIVAGDFNAEPGDTATWSAWSAEYADAWISSVNPASGSAGFTMPVRSTTGRPGRIDYQWYANAKPARVELVQTQLSDHYALVVDWVVTAR